MRILVITAVNYDPIKMFCQIRKLIKGLILQGHDVLEFNYVRALRAVSPFRSNGLSLKLYKHKADRMLIEQAVAYRPDVVIVTFAKGLDRRSMESLREQVPNAVYVGHDDDPWPKLIPGKIDTARCLDIVLATNDSEWLTDYRDAGVRLCAFLPPCCDPDIDRRYKVGDEWKADLLWIGALEHKADTRYTLRRELVLRLAQEENCRVYGCCGGPKVRGFDTLYAISGARIAVNVNACDGIRLGHSDRLTRFLAGGPLVLANRFPDCDLLYRDKEHLVYFEHMDEFFELSRWYLDHEDERERIAHAGMLHVHAEFNCSRIAGYLMDIVEKGSYIAPWT
ncbi:MAG: glycosyltransferase [Phycisphaerales bacterium]